MTESLAQHVALVTGASSGIGRAICRALAVPGARLFLVGRNEAALAALAAELSDTGASAEVFAADLEDVASLERIPLQLADAAARVDVLVHSAGAHVPARWLESDVANLDYQYRVNVRAPYVLTRLLLPDLIAARGQVVFVNSSAGQTASAGVGQYAATKHALKALADSLRAEVNAEGVRVLSVYPGRTATPMQAALFEREQRTYTPARLLQPEDVAAAVVHALQLPRTAEITDLMIRPFLKS